MNQKEKYVVWLSVVVLFLVIIVIPVTADITGVYWGANESATDGDMRGKAVLKTDTAVYSAGVVNDGSGGFDAHIIKYSHKGNKLWEQEFDNYMSQVDSDMDIVEGNNGNIYLAFTSYQSTADEQQNLRLAKFTPKGKLLWHKKYDQSGGSAVREWFSEMVVTKDNHIILGYTKYTVDSDNNEMALAEFNSSGGFIRSYSEFMPDGFKLYSLTIHDNYLYVGGEEMSANAPVTVKVSRPNFNHVWNATDSTPEGVVKDVVVTTNDTVLTLFEGDASKYFHFYGYNLSGSRLFHTTYSVENYPRGMVKATNNTVIAWDVGKIMRFHANGTIIWKYKDGPDVQAINDLTTNESGIITNGVEDTYMRTVSYATENMTEVIPPPPPPTFTEKIVLDAPEWIKPNTTVPYQVEYYKTYKSNDTTIFKDVTANATVTSNNTSVLTVNNSTFTLHAKDVNNTVIVNATYQGLSDNKTITVARRTIENIGIMPPGQFLPTFLGIGEKQAVWGIGTRIQLVWFCIGIGAVIGYLSRNPLAAIATADILLILFWVAGYVTLGTTMVSTFFAIFAGLLYVSSHRGRDTNVSIQR